MLLTTFGHWLLWSFQCCLIIWLLRFSRCWMLPQSQRCRLNFHRLEFKWKSQEDHSLSEHGSSSHVALGRSAQSHRVFASLDLLLTSFGRWLFCPFKCWASFSFLWFDEDGRVLIVAAKPHKLPSSSVKMGIVKKVMCCLSHASGS